MATSVEVRRRAEAREEASLGLAKARQTPEPHSLNALFPPARGVGHVLGSKAVWKSDFGSAGSVGSCWAPPEGEVKASRTLSSPSASVK